MCITILGKRYWISMYNYTYILALVLVLGGGYSLLAIPLLFAVDFVPSTKGADNSRREPLPADLRANVALPASIFGGSSTHIIYIYIYIFMRASEKVEGRFHM